MEFLILNETQKDQVKGTYNSFFALDPVVLVSGIEWVLPLEVINKPEFASVNDILLSLTQREVNQNEFPV